MRSEREMHDLILGIARADDRIRVVLQTGSRVNPNAPSDPFRDFDIIYLVTDLAPFVRNSQWIRAFGEIMILQTPDDMVDPPPEQTAGYAYLIQFMDGNRIDLGIFPLSHLSEVRKDSLTVLLLDKDGTVDPFPPPDERSYLPTRPSLRQFADCCNEFWWVCPYIAKGLWRGQWIYAKHMLDVVLRRQLIEMLTWYVGVGTHFTRNVGLFGKNLDRYLEPELARLLGETYTDAAPENMWSALLAMGRLFRQTALVIGQRFDYAYPLEEDRRVTAHLEHVRRLPHDAETIY